MQIYNKKHHVAQLRINCENLWSSSLHWVTSPVRTFLYSKRWKEIVKSSAEAQLLLRMIGTLQHDSVVSRGAGQFIFSIRTIFSSANKLTHASYPLAWESVYNWREISWWNSPVTWWQNTPSHGAKIFSQDSMLNLSGRRFQCLHS